MNEKALRINVPSGLISKAVWLSWFTIGYNLLEGVISISFGLQDDSVALAGFGVDSLIEVASASLVLWRFQGEHGRTKNLSIDRERKTTFGIGILFLLLSAVTLFSSLWQLNLRSHPETTLPGLIISSISLSFMFYLWSAKRKVALELDSSTVMKDAECSLACIKLSIVLFLGSLLFLAIPSLWWADSVAALVIAVYIAKEGWSTIRAARSEEFSGGCGCSHS